MSFLKTFIIFVDNLNDWMGKILGFLIYPTMFILVYEVIMRYAFNKPTIWAHDTSCMLYGAHFILGGAYALRWGAFVNVEVFYQRFSLRTKAVVDLVTWMLFYAFVGILLWKSVPWAWASVMVQEYSNSPWGPPVWPIKLTIPVAATLVLLQGLTKTIKDFYIAVTGRELFAGVATEVTEDN
ncbi:Tripartite ATP-independent periplasmic transporter DctQ component [Aminobacterium colombiense DSM 12261]|uniref:Tripartite ATP-independent periplasmic transporter DctQ component n=1 Tax=Aminobacterium colombiense (strain DSM 12261 / ALA-1) TaxID=572547 RepID=D5EDG7_AMICL|nr:Tripartite ATP-independent periplasmic transporter DctQ component [Aminobacterium colombiense DSM 12261]